MFYALATICLVTFALVLKKTSGKSEQQKNQDLQYQQVNSLITPTEKKFLDTLDQVVDNRARVFSMVRVADVIKPKKSLDKSHRHRHFLKTSQKHFDFVLCDPKTLKLLCVIELNDKSHQRKDRKERDQFLLDACETANLALYFIPVSNSYDANKILELIDQHLPVQLKQVS